MRDKKSQKWPMYLTYQLYIHEAFRSLKPAARDILPLLYYEIEYPNRKKKGKYDATIMNRHEIRLPYVEIRDRLGYSDKTIWESFRQLLAHGFIEVVKPGGGFKGDCAVYSISEKWRTWTPGKVITETPFRKKIGFQKKKISSSTGKALRSTTGKAPTPENVLYLTYG